MGFLQILFIYCHLDGVILHLASIERQIGIVVVTKNLMGFMPIHSIEELCVLGSVVQLCRYTGRLRRTV